MVRVNHLTIGYTATFFRLLCSSKNAREHGRYASHQIQQQAETKGAAE